MCVIFDPEAPRSEIGAGVAGKSKIGSGDGGEGRQGSVTATVPAYRVGGPRVVPVIHIQSITHTSWTVRHTEVQIVQADNLAERSRD